MAIEIGDFPIKHGDFPQLCNKLPEGTSKKPQGMLKEVVYSLRRNDSTVLCSTEVKFVERAPAIQIYGLN